MALRLAALLLFISIATASADESVARWKVAFPTAALGQHVPGMDVDVLVVGGTHAEVAADALRQNLATCPSVRRAARVTPPSTVVSDEARIAWAQRRAATEAIFYVQLENDGSDRKSAIVSIFDTQGRARGTLFASPSSPMAMGEGSKPASGLSVGALASVDAALSRPREIPTAPASTLAPRVVIPNDAAGRPLLDQAYSFVPDDGAGSRQQLHGDELYTALGRDDWARSYRTRKQSRTVLVATGGTLIGVGALVGLSVLAAGALDNLGESSSHGKTLMAAGGGTFGISVALGATFIVIGKLTPQAPVSPTRVAKLAEKRRREIEAKEGEGGVVGGIYGDALE